jgi:hypothetical protein
LDLYDVEVWKKYGWSPIYTQEFRRRYTNHKSESPSAEADLDVYLAAMLKRARRFQAALDAGSVANQPVALLAMGGDCEETLNSPVLYRDQKENRWVTLIRPREFRNSSGQKISKRQLTEAMYAREMDASPGVSAGRERLNDVGHETVIYLPLATLCLL